jgi:all-trans-retinol dehydrogenase (NAD+)
MLAKKFAKLGAIIVAWDIDEKSNDNTVREIKQEGGKAYAFKCDMCNREEIYRVAKKVCQNHSHLSLSLSLSFSLAL